jgi:hypothetical protein
MKQHEQEHNKDINKIKKKDYKNVRKIILLFLVAAGESFYGANPWDR